MNDDAIRQHLESSGALDAASLEEADQYARSRRRPLAEAIVELGLLSDTDVYRKGVAPAAGLKFVDVGSKRIPDAVVQRLPGNVAIDNRTVPVADLKGVLFVAIDDPERVFVLDSNGSSARKACEGSVDEVKPDIVTLLEGGEDAFKARKTRYAY